MNFAEKLRMIRTANEMTQKDVAEKIGVQARYYQELEYGKYKPGFDNLIAIADLFEVSLDYLLDRQNFDKRKEIRIAEETHLAYMHSAGHLRGTEKAEVMKTLLGSQCFPLDGESCDDLDEDTGDLIFRAIDMCDYFVLLAGETGGTYGSVIPVYKYAAQINKPRLLLLRDDFFSPPSNAQEEELHRFVDEDRDAQAIWSAGNLPEIAAKAVAKLKKRYPTAGWVPANAITRHQLLLERDLRLKIDKLEEMNVALPTRAIPSKPLEALGME